ncbi:MAG: hypothetical protein NVS4B8_15360 [Herpetosiphon sp.]
MTAGFPISNPTRLAEWPSLLWPAGSDRGFTLSSPTFLDLAFDDLVTALDPAGQFLRSIRTALGEIPTCPTVIAYRQEICADLLSHPTLVEHVQSVLPRLAALSFGPNAWPGDLPITEVATRVNELAELVSIVTALQISLESETALASRGLLDLRSAIVSFAASPIVVALQKELPALQEQLHNIGSVTIGINLDAGLRPASAVLLSLQPSHFGSARSLLGRLFGSDTPAFSGHLHPVSTNPLGNGSSLLQRDVDHLIAGALQPIAAALHRYHQLHVRGFAGLTNELAFWLAAVALDKRLTAAGIALAHPLIEPPSERSGRLTGLVNITLALRLLPLHTVSNDFAFDSGRVVIVTGPNHGGKTTFLRAVGQAQCMFQLGLRVAATAAQLAPVDAVLTHFPTAETLEAGFGRLDEEARRLAAIFDQATPRSLVLLNEPLTSTSEREALLIAGDLVKGLRLLGARSLLVTHLHTLVPAIDASPPDGKEPIQSLVAEIESTGPDLQRTYRMKPGMPAGNSFAVDIAVKHGLTWQQLATAIRRRLADTDGAR